MIDTDLTFNEFFFQDHTVMVRLMPRYPYAYAGPILAENGVGTVPSGGEVTIDGAMEGFLEEAILVIFIKIGNSYATL